MIDDVIKGFDANAKEYDQERKQLIPCFDDFYGMAVHLVKTDKKAPKILDLGAGTGLLSAFVLNKYPEAELTLIDLSEKMLERARARFGEQDNIRYLVEDYTKYPYGEKYDFVISSLSIHHLPHPLKRELFQLIRGILVEGGQFINADQLQGTTPLIDKFYWQEWEKSVRASGLSEEALQASRERRQLDINATLQDQVQWLLDAGFSEVDCVFKRYDLGVFWAR